MRARTLLLVRSQPSSAPRTRTPQRPMVRLGRHPISMVPPLLEIPPYQAHQTTHRSEEPDETEHCGRPTSYLARDSRFAGHTRPSKARPVDDTTAFYAGDRSISVGSPHRKVEIGILVSAEGGLVFASADRTRKVQRASSLRPAVCPHSSIMQNAHSWWEPGWDRSVALTKRDGLRAICGGRQHRRPGLRADKQMA